MTGHWSFAWRMSFRTIGWAFPLVSLVGLFLVCLFPNLRSRAVEIVIPLIAALQASFLFAPDDEPALELMLSAPRPAAWIVYERLTALLLMQLSVGLVASVLLTTLPETPSLSALIVGWLPPTLALIGLSAAITFMMRRSSFGLLTAIFIYLALLFAGDLAVMQWNFTWVVHLFMQPQIAYLFATQWNTSPDVLYAVNRIVPVLIGVGSIAWVVYGLRDEERVLGAGNKG